MVVSSYDLECRNERYLRREAESLKQAVPPAVARAEQVGRGEDVQEHAGCEEGAHPGGVGSGDALDELDELAVAATHQPAHLRVVAGGVRLQLQREPRP